MTTLGEYVKDVIARITEYGANWASEDELDHVAEKLSKLEQPPQERRWFWQEIANQLSAARDFSKSELDWDNITELREMVMEQLAMEGEG